MIRSPCGSDLEGNAEDNLSGTVTSLGEYEAVGRMGKADMAMLEGSGLEMFTSARMEYRDGERSIPVFFPPL